MTSPDRDHEITLLYLSVFQNSADPWLSGADIAAMNDRNSDEYKHWLTLVAGTKFSDSDVKELQRETALFTLRGEPGGSPKHLAAYLQNVARTGQICPVVADLLAKAIDPNALSDLRLLLAPRTKRGRPRSRAARSRGFRAAQLVRELEEEGMSKEAAVAEAVRTLGLGTSQVYEWLLERADYMSIPETPEFLETIREAAKGGKRNFDQQVAPRKHDPNDWDSD
jgi:hypothetical protein